MKLNIYAVWPNTNLHACSGYRNYHNSCVAFACLLPFVLKMASKIPSWWSFDKQIHTCIFLPSMNTADGGWKCRSTTVSTSSDHRGKRSGSQGPAGSLVRDLLVISTCCPQDESGFSLSPFELFLQPALLLLRQRLWFGSAHTSCRALCSGLRAAFPPALLLVHHSKQLLQTPWGPSSIWSSKLLL